MVAGVIGALCGTPGDVALVRMTIDRSLPVAERANYRSGSLWDFLYLAQLLKIILNNVLTNNQ